MKMAYFLLCICVTLALQSLLTEARRDPGMRTEEWNRRTLSSADGTLTNSLPESAKVPEDAVTEVESLSEHEKVDGAVEQTARETEQKESEMTEESNEDEVVCTESGSCYEKRVLTATVDYKNDGPNNPITDPPH
ncbi:hypothetical protein R1flu_025250 [Riccia fluitans]|uniref:Phytosulfokine-beta n=1 Tax=Riccia fluitans TaxID=41844 RepID=A0ABD1Y1D0_9MARC